MSEQVKLYTDIECFTREFSFIRSQYCMPYFKQNYKEEHKIYEQYETLINKMFKKLYDYEQENKELKEQKEKIYLWAINSKYKLDTLPPNYSYVIDGNRLKELLEILGDKENE